MKVAQRSAGIPHSGLFDDVDSNKTDELSLLTTLAPAVRRQMVPLKSAHSFLESAH
jgi:hypothetical protein